MSFNAVLKLLAQNHVYIVCTLRTSTYPLIPVSSGTKDGTPQFALFPANPFLDVLLYVTSCSYILDFETSFPLHALL